MFETYVRVCAFHIHGMVSITDQTDRPPHIDPEGRREREEACAEGLCRNLTECCFGVSLLVGDLRSTFAVFSSLSGAWCCLGSSQQNRALHWTFA